MNAQDQALSASDRPLGRLAILLYGTTVYGLFLFTFLAVVGFLGGFVNPLTIDTGREAAFGHAFLINASILGLFAIQHTIMARIGFKKWWTKIIPASAERSTFVLVTCSILWLLMTQWRPMPAVVWSVQDETLAWTLRGISFFGWGIVLVSTFLIDHFELFGLKQVLRHFRGRRAAETPFQVNSLYRHVRHPLYVGFLIAFWATPHMSLGHLVYALMTTGYLFVGIQIEERTLVAIHGDDYVSYKRRVPMLMPRLRPDAAVRPNVEPVAEPATEA